MCAGIDIRLVMFDVICAVFAVILLVLILHLLGVLLCLFFGLLSCYI